MLIDTHTHLYLDEFAPDNESAVDRAVESGIGHMVFPNVDMSTLPLMKSLHELRPEVTSMAIGLHPTEVDDSPVERQLAFVDSELSGSAEYVAIGEIGIDLYWDKSHRISQMEIFGRQMAMAADLGLPAIIHCREGLDEVLEVLGSLDNVPQAVFHSFGGSVGDVERIRKVGDFYFGINGIVTFKNSRLRDVLPVIGLDRILLETDAPYLAPVPMRGRRNESAFMIHTAAYVADSMNTDIRSVAEATTRSARKLFRL